MDMMTTPDVPGITAGQRLARDLVTGTVARIADAAPSGLPDWLPRLDAIQTADTAALDALHHLERHTGGVGIGQCVDAAKAACDTLVREWSRAARRYTAAGRPRSA